MGTQTVPTELFQGEMPEPLEEGKETTPPETPTETPAKAAAEPGKETPEPGKEPPAPAAPTEPELIKMPDGRELPVAEAAREMKENFLPEYTRTTQELARLKSNPLTTTTPETPTKSEKFWENPDWVPGSTKELLDAAVLALEDKQQTKAAAEAQAIAQVRTETEQTLTELKAKDPQLNEEALFKHANKYNFSDLKLAYANMQEIQSQRKQTLEEISKAKTERTDEPVNGSPAISAGPDEGGVDYDRISSADTVALVQDHWARLKK